MPFPVSVSALGAGTFTQAGRYASHHLMVGPSAVRGEGTSAVATGDTVRMQHSISEVGLV